MPAIGLLGLDYGPMLAAERRAAITPPAAAAGTTAPRGTAARAGGGVLALGVVAVVIGAVLLWTGGYPQRGALAALAAGHSVPAVTAGFAIGALVLALSLLRQGVMETGAIARNCSWKSGALGRRTRWPR